MKRARLSLSLSLALAVLGCSGSDPEPGAVPPPAKSLAGTATVGDACEASLHAVVGAEGSCSIAPGAAPQVHFLARSGGTGTLAAGQSWTLDDAAASGFTYVHFYRNGAGGNREAASSASLSIVEVTGATARMRYAFTTADGERYEGEATAAVCPSTPICP